MSSNGLVFYPDYCFSSYLFINEISLTGVENCLLIKKLCYFPQESLKGDESMSFPLFYYERTRSYYCNCLKNPLFG